MRALALRGTRAAFVAVLIPTCLAVSSCIWIPEGGEGHHGRDDDRGEHRGEGHHGDDHEHFSGEHAADPYRDR